jgi:hypothetical protein
MILAPKGFMMLNYTTCLDVNLYIYESMPYFEMDGPCGIASAEAALIV